ncbi:hypothetical protein [Mycolicibacterium palauense]|uniref:hypothetical protein n=1 Tax=Mycolicibacterium palauense TaxID=2034511 RepID=UPI00159BC4B8|nr:hypothetical protein [Mycolicibacterium palauense]
MATHPVHPVHPFGHSAMQSSPQLYVASPTCNRSYLIAALRAGIIALVLLGVLVLVVLT